MEGQNQQNILDTTLIDYENLPAPPELDQKLLGTLDAHLKGPWQGSFQCITMIRSICKYFPQHIPNLFTKYGPTILQLYAHPTTALMKNILRMLGEIFNCGAEVNLQGCVNAFLPLLLKKAAMDTGQVKTMCQEVLTIIASKCCYCNTIEITVQTIADKDSKNEGMKELALQLLAGILNSLSQSLTQINPQTLKIIMQGMYQLIVGRRNNMKTSALDTCIFIYNQIGSENYLQLMNYSLNQQAVLTMGQAMEQHRTQKTKAPQFSEVIKQQKSVMRQNGGVGQNMRM